ncbi:MAG: diguanylate cyclase domain-containing protein [Ignavibacteriales bacterium]
MKNRKWLIVGIVAVLIIISGIVIYILNREDSDTTLTILEKKWIESNKNTVIDLEILNNISLLNYEGEGIFFDFLESLETDTDLAFNKVSYNKISDTESDYAFKIVNKVGKKDILIYSDNYAVITKEKIKYSNLSELKDLKIGVLNNNLDDANKYLGGNLSLQTFDSPEAMVAEISKEDTTIDAIVLPKLEFLKEYNSDLYITYNITEMQNNYVLSLGNIDKLNNILVKYYQKWYNENYEDSYNLHLSNSYFIANEVDEQTKVKFRSKRYVYGYINNLPYDATIDGENIGLNQAIVDKFAEIANIEIIYKEYDTVTKLLDEFNANNIDFFFSNYRNNKYAMDTYTTVSPYEEKAVIVSSLKKDLVVNSVNSLKGETVLVLKSSQIGKYLNDKGIQVKEFSNIKDMLEKKDSTSILAITPEIYNYYSIKDLVGYKVDYSFDLNTNYGYIVRDIKNNELFQNYLNFYLGFTIEKDIINNSYRQLFNATSENTVFKTLLLTVAAIVNLFIIGYAIYKFNPTKKKKKKISLTKEDKLKYVDMLTSLKNRNYLNDNVEKWDDSEVYPQTIIIIDLNNVAYINDNYGHKEGDNVIKEAANILITNQVPNSDIIRTNGNEFLVYMVEYDEKQVIAYMRKLSKEFKNLAHGFGAAIGYSIITDQIKTIDDAINEATLDMRNNKEELNN